MGPLLLLLLLVWGPSAAEAPAAGGETAARAAVASARSHTSAGAEQEARQALAQLASPRAAERNAAERWLAQHLRTGDLAEVAQVANGASLEVRRRLETALGADQRHFDLCALLLAEPAPEVADLGALGLRRLVAAWSGSASLSPVAGNLALRTLEGRVHQRWSLRPDEGSLALALERVLQRAGREARQLPGGPMLGVALDPALDVVVLERASGGSALGRIEGGFAELLLAVVSAHSVRLEGFGLDGPGPWVRVAAPADVGVATGEELLVRWVRAVLEAGGRPEGAPAARALASVGWPAALRWLESRWFERADANGLEGVLAAAARGAVVPSLARAERVRTLLAYADKRLAEGDAQALREVRGIHGALAALRPVGSDGSDLGAAVFEGFSAASPAGKSLRLSILADLGRLPPAAREQLRAELAGAAPQLAVLRVLASARDDRTEPLVVTRPRPLLEQAARAGILPLAITWLKALGALPPPEWRQAQALPAQWSSELRAGVYAWWQSSGDPQAEAAAPEHLLALAAHIPETDEAAVGRVLAALARSGYGQPVQASFQIAMQRASDERARAVLERLAAHAGTAGPEGTERLLATLAAVERPGAGVYAALAALSRGTHGARARAAFLAAVQRDLERGAAAEPAWAEPAAEVLRGLEQSGQELELRALRRDLRAALARAKHPLHGRLDRMPAPAGPEALPMEAFEPQLAPGPAAGR